MAKNNRLIFLSFLLISLLATQCASASQYLPFTQVNDPTPPIIEVWYGSHQVFGAIGMPQKWINVLGNISDPDSRITQASFRINNGTTVPLKLGPDKRRLALAGDFNIEIDRADLKSGNHTVEITATNAGGVSISTTMTIEFKPNTATLPYSIDWSQVKNLQDVVQVIDGEWTWDAGGVRPTVIDYDRVLAVGDMSWMDFEATVPVTVHGINSNSYNIPESGGAGFGLLFRWLGHTDNPVRCDWPAQPHCGWNPLGASNWYSFKKTGIDTLAIEASPPEGSIQITSWKIQFGHTYMFKARVENRTDGNFYQFKVWEPAAESEPAAWTLERTATPGDDINGNLRHGSLLLVAHNVDVTFGNLEVTGLPQAEMRQMLYLPVALR